MDENNVKMTENGAQQYEATGLYHNETDTLQTVRTDSETRVSLQTASQDAESRIVFYQTDASKIVERAAKLNSSNHFEDVNVKSFVGEMARHAEVLSRVGTEISYSNSIAVIQQTFSKKLSELINTLEDTGSDEPVYADYLEAVSLVGEMIGTADRYFEDGKKTLKGEKTRFNGNLSELLGNFKAFYEYYAGNDLLDELEDDELLGLTGAEFTLERESDREKKELAKSVRSAETYRDGDLVGTIRQIKSQMQELDEKIPEVLKDYFSGVTTWPEFEARVKEYNKIDEERDFTELLTNRVNEYLGSLGYSFKVGGIRDLMSRYENSEAGEHYMQAWNLLHSDYAGDIPDEVIRHVNDFFEANLEEFKICSKNRLQHEIEDQAMPLMWQRMGLEYRMAILLAEDPAAKKETDAIETVLNSFGKELESGIETGQPLAEYDALVRALKNAGEEGGIEALAESAQKYISKEEEKQPEEQDDFRISVTKQILTVTQTARSIEEHHAERMELYAMEAASKPVQAEERPSVMSAKEERTIVIADSLSAADIKEEAARLRVELEEKEREKARIAAAKQEEAEREVARREAEKLKREQEKKAQEEAKKAADEVRTAEDAARLAEKNRHRYDNLLMDEQGNPIPTSKHPDGQVRPYFPIDVHTVRGRRFLEGEVLGFVAREKPDASYEECLAIVAKMMEIHDNNLTGNKTRDIANLYAEYRDAFMVAPEGGEALLEAAAVKGGLLISLECLIRQVAQYDDTLQLYGMRKDDPDPLKTIEDIQLGEIRAKAEAYRKYTAEIETAGPILEELMNIELTGNYRFDNVNMARVISKAFPSTSFFQPPALTRHFSIENYVINATNPLYNVMNTYSKKIDFVKFRDKNASVADLQKEYKAALRDALDKRNFPLNSDFVAKLVEVTKRDNLTPEERSFLLESSQNDLVALQDLYAELGDFSDAFDASVLMHKERSQKATEFDKERTKAYIKDNKQVLAYDAAREAELKAAEKAKAEKAEAKPDTAKTEEQPETAKPEEQPLSLYERVLNLSSENHIPDKGLQAVLMGMALDADALGKEDPGVDISANLTNITKNYPAVMAFVNKKLASTDPGDPAYEEYREFAALGAEITELAKQRSAAMPENTPGEAVTPDEDNLEDDGIEYRTGSSKPADDLAEDIPENGGLEEMLSAIRTENGSLPYIATGNVAIDNEYAFITNQVLIASLVRESDGTAEEIISGVAKMKEILDYNLTGDYARDSEHITREYEKAFYEAPAGEKPLIQRPDGKSGNIPTINYILDFARKYDENIAEITQGAQGPELRAKLEKDLPEKVQKKYDGIQKSVGDLNSALDTIRKGLADITLTGSIDLDAAELDIWMKRSYPDKVTEDRMYNSFDSLCAHYAWKWKVAADNYLFEYEEKISNAVLQPGSEETVAAIKEEYRKGLTSVLQDAEFEFTPDFCENMVTLSNAEDLTLEQKNYLLNAGPRALKELQPVLKNGGDVRASFDMFMQQRAEKEAAAREKQNKNVAAFIEDAKTTPETERTPEQLALIYSDAAKFSGEWDWDVNYTRFSFDLSPETMMKNIMPDTPEDQETAGNAEEKTEESKTEAEKEQQYDALGNPILENGGNSQVKNISEALGSLKSDPDEYNPFVNGWSSDEQMTANGADKKPGETQPLDASDNPVTPENEESPILKGLREAVRNQVADQDERTSVGPGWPSEEQKTPENADGNMVDDDPFGIKAEAAKRGISIEEAARILLDQDRAIQWANAAKQMANGETKTEDGPSWNFEQFDDVQPENSKTGESVNSDDPFGIKAEAAKRGISIEEAARILLDQDRAIQWANATKQMANGETKTEGPSWNFEQFADVQPEKPQNEEPVDWNAVMAEVARNNKAAENKQEDGPSWNFELFNDGNAEDPKEEVKQEEPKPEEVKAEEPKPEEVKAEEPKPEPSLAAMVNARAADSKVSHGISWLNMVQRSTFGNSNPEIAVALQKIERFNAAEAELGELAVKLDKTRNAEARKTLEDSIKDRVSGSIRQSIDDAWNHVSLALDKIDYTDRSFETLNNLASYLEDCRNIYGQIEPDSYEHRMLDRKGLFDDLYKKLDTYKKTFTADTEEFTEFKTSLLEAINGGDVKKLYHAAKRYESEKTKNGTQPNTQNGKNRLTIAKRVLALISPEEVREPEAAKDIKVDNKPEIAEEIKVESKPEVVEEIKAENKPEADEGSKVVEEPVPAAEPEAQAEPEKPIEPEKPDILQEARNTIRKPDATLPEVRAAIGILLADKVLEGAVVFNQQIRDEYRETYADFMAKKGYVAKMSDGDVAGFRDKLKGANSDFRFGIFIEDEARKVTPGAVSYAKLRDNGIKAENYLRSMPGESSPETLEQAQKSCVDVLLYKYMSSLGSMDNDTKTYRNIVMRDDAFYSGEVDCARKTIGELDIVKDAMGDPAKMKKLLSTPERELVRKVTYPSRLKAMEDNSWNVLESTSSTPEEITDAVSMLLTVAGFKESDVKMMERISGKSLDDPKSNPSIFQRGMAFEKFLKTQADELQKKDAFRQFCSDPQSLRSDLLRQKDPNIQKSREYSDPDLRAGRWLLTKFNLSNENNSLIKNNQSVAAEAYSRKAFASKLNQLKLPLPEGIQALVHLAIQKDRNNGKAFSDQIMQNAQTAIVKDGQERDAALKDFKKLVSRACDQSIKHLTNNAAQYDTWFSAIANSGGDKAIPDAEMASTVLECYQGYFGGKNRPKVDENCAKHISSIFENSDKASARIQAQLAKQASAKKQNAGPVK